MGTGGKAKQGRGERFLGRSATFYQDFHIMAGSTKRVPSWGKIILPDQVGPWQKVGAQVIFFLSCFILTFLRFFFFFHKK